MSDIILDSNAPKQPAEGEARSLDLGPQTGGQASPAAPTAAIGGVIKESDTDHFMADVIEASQTVPVIVDFWAPWCGPCKTLGPMLEKLVARAGGLVKMVKINVDENQSLAAQLRVQSVPTVFAFKGGRPVDAFAGALPESQIQGFIDKLVGDAKPPIEAAMDDAHELMDAGQAPEAENLFATILAQDPSFVPALAGMIRAIAAQGDFDRARELVASLDAKTSILPEVAQAVSALELAQDSAGAGGADTAELEARLAKNPKDLEARYDLAQALYARGRAQDAIDHLLEIVRLDRAWNDEAGRKQLLKVFDTLGPTDPLVAEARRRLSAVLFS